MILIRRFGWSE